MILFKQKSDIYNYTENQLKTGKKIGFVPTMGALHQGHLQLIEAALFENEICICSIFINPTQFNNPNDLIKYPKTLERDIELLETIGCHVLFLPSAEEIYPKGTKNLNKYPIGYLENAIEGAARPGHYQGVCSVLVALFKIIRTHNLYMGQKDYQQCLVVANLLTYIELPNSIQLHVIETMRESEGLAMSSRNLRLNEVERIKAATIYKTLLYLKNNIQKGTLRSLLNDSIKSLTESGFTVDYLIIAEKDTLQPIEPWNGETKIIALIAASIGDVRLIDNLLLN